VVRSLDETVRTLHADAPGQLPALALVLPVLDQLAVLLAALVLVAGPARAGLADRVHQPHRAALYPRSMELVERAPDLGALGATISGAGPTVLVWAFWQSGRGLLDRLAEFADGWADVRRTQFSPRGARVEIA